jgi:hypothetical protein
MSLLEEEDLYWLFVLDEEDDDREVYFPVLERPDSEEDRELVSLLGYFCIIGRAVLESTFTGVSLLEEEDLCWLFVLVRDAVGEERELYFFILTDELLLVVTP